MTVATRGLTLARRLGAGGEAEVFDVAERPGFAFKRFRSAVPGRDEKLRVMLANPPEGADAGGHVAIAWPSELVVGDGGRVEGFLMPRIDLSRTVPLFQVYNPASRLEIAPGFSWRYLLRTARNVAAIVDSLHRSGYVVGDINESNLLVNRRALAVLVDCDSMQVRDPNTGGVHRGGVGKPEFTAPELQGRDLATVDRTTSSDDFALAVLIFQLLLEGVHPFAGVWKGRGEPPDVPERMRRGQFPYRRGAPVAPPPRALGLDTLPPELRRLARRAFTTGIRRPHLRPTAASWADALERADASLRSCDRSPHHVFGGHRRRCPWCDRFDRGLPDPFPGPDRASPLIRRPPPWPARARATVAAVVAATASAVIAWFGARLRSLAASAWSRLRGPLTGTVPLAVAAAAAGALVPAAAAGVFVARHAAVPRLRRRPVRWVPPLTEAAAALVPALVATAFLAGGPPSPSDAAAVTAGLTLAIGVLQWDRSRKRPAGTAEPLRLVAVVAWLAAATVTAALWWTGTLWWPIG